MGARNTEVVNKASAVKEFSVVDPVCRSFQYALYKAGAACIGRALNSLPLLH